MQPAGVKMAAARVKMVAAMMVVPEAVAREASEARRAPGVQGMGL